jgi:hypothetical protein
MPNMTVCGVSALLMGLGGRMGWVCEKDRERLEEVF